MKLYVYFKTTSILSYIMEQNSYLLLLGVLFDIPICPSGHVHSLSCEFQRRLLYILHTIANLAHSNNDFYVCFYILVNNTYIRQQKKCQ